MIEIFKRNLTEIRQRIADAAVKSGRTETDVQLVAVTKYVDADVTRKLIEAGCSVLGENRPQQLWSKAEALKDTNIQWHMIGHLQRNKVKRTVEVSSLIHSVDSLRLLQAIEKAATEQNKISDVLIEINVSRESAKHGLMPNELPDILKQVVEMNSIKVCGLMCMAGLSSDDAETVREFDLLRELRDENQGFNCAAVELIELSMGMSGDYEMAVEHGATLVRVGSAIFSGIE